MRYLIGRCTKCDVTIKVVLGTLTPEEARKKLEGIQMFECPGHHVELSGPLGYWEIDCYVAKCSYVGGLFLFSR